jgi:hypothetical protein
MFLKAGFLWVFRVLERKNKSSQSQSLEPNLSKPVLETALTSFEPS